MRYLKLYEAFKSEILTKVLSFIHPSSQNQFIEVLKKICHYFDFPVSELNDELFQKMPFDKALRLFVDDNHEKGKIKWIKFWFDRQGKYLCATGVDGTIKKIEKESSIEDYDMVRPLRLDDFNNLDTGDKVYIQLEMGEDKVIATTFVDEDNQVYMIQNRNNGTTPEYTDEWQKYGNYSWVIMSAGDFYGTPYLLKEKLKSEVETELQNPYEFNFLFSGTTLYKEPVEKNLKTASFALVFDWATLGKKWSAGDYKLKRDIESERTLAKKGALALMTDNEIKTRNLNRYFDGIAQKIKFDTELKNIKSLMLKSFGGRKILIHVLDGSFRDNIRLINGVYAFLELQKLEQDSITTDTIKTTIFSIEKNCRYNYEEFLQINSNIDNKIGSLKASLKEEMDSPLYTEDFKKKAKSILSIIDKFEKLVEDFFIAFNSKKIETLSDVEINHYKLTSIYQLYTESDRFKNLKSFLRHVENGDNGIRRYSPEGIEKIDEAIDSFKELSLKLIQ